MSQTTVRNQPVRSIKNRVNQVYEKYWNYTAAFTDFSGSKFLDTLKTCLDFIDSHKGTFSEAVYSSLQETLQKAVPVTGNGWDATQRKRINQLVKLGFINPFLSSYTQLSRDYLDAKTDRKRKNILSKIVYKYANFCNSTTNDVQTAQLSFFLKSLEEVESFNDWDLATLMTIDIASFGKDYADRQDLDQRCQEYDVRGFIERKYNQISHLKNVLGKIDDLVVYDKSIYFKTDAEQLFGNEMSKKNVRDPYLQRVYKSELEDESCSQYHCETPKCMLEGLCYPVMIASHIKPYSHCDEKDQFAVNNGLLLSKNLDSLFDLGYITFDDDGIIVPSKVLDQDLINYLSRYRLNKCFINPERMKYMEYHRANVFEKKFSRSHGMRKNTFQMAREVELYSNVADNGVKI